MRHNIFISTLFLLCALPLSAQTGEQGLDIRTGYGYSITSDGTAVRDASRLCIDFDYRRGAALAGVSLRTCGNGSSQRLDLDAKAGLSWRGKLLSAAPFLFARCTWQDGPGGFRAGYGGYAVLRVAGPVGLYVDFRSAHAVSRNKTGYSIPAAGRHEFSFGITLNI